MKGPQAQFFDYLHAGKFMLQKLNTDGKCVFYPRELSPTGDDWAWVEASGDGVVYSRTIVRQKPERGGDFCMAIVELAEGPRMMTRILGISPDDVNIGMRVKASVEVPIWDWPDGPVVVFRPVDDTGGSRGA